jgi:cysteine-rich repeat protein
MRTSMPPVVFAARPLLGLLAIIVTGCAEPDVVACADGRYCPLGTLCVARGCAAPGCGDADVDAFFGEQCDDGNLASGDGCSATCLLELCGNGILDRTTGEQCDDGNLQSHDGCSSGCLVEQPQWHQLVLAGLPATRHSAAAAWDPDEGRAVMHGGRIDGAATPTNEVWTFDGAWHPEPAGPPALAEHAMASDGRGSLVLFGGNSDECWLWTGSWTTCPGPRAPAHAGHAMATRPGGGVVMIGGTTTLDRRATWVWSGAGWTNSDIVGPELANPAMACDRARGHVVLAGVSIGLLGADTNVLGASWVSIGADLPRFGIGMAYDPARRRVVTYGGEDFGGMFLDDVHELDADRWVLVPTSPRPPPIANAVVFYDAIHHGLIVMGGHYLTRENATWTLRWESTTPDEGCADSGADADADGLAGCDDPDCWAQCDPRCPIGAIDCAPDRPRCGDSTCNPWIETSALCPQDCP